MFLCFLFQVRINGQLNGFQMPKWIGITGQSNSIPSFEIYLFKTEDGLGRTLGKYCNLQVSIVLHRQMSASQIKTIIIVDPCNRKRFTMKKDF